MLASEQSVSEFALPAIDLRAAAKRAAVPVALGAFAIAALFVLGGHARAFTDALARGLDVSPIWAFAAIAFELISLAGYVLLLALVAGRATPRVGTRESVHITFAGAAATRLLPTAGAGGLALALWALRRAGLGAASATRTLLAFLVLLYAVFLGSIVLAGGALALGVVHSRGPEALSAIPALAAAVAIAAALVLARTRRTNELPANVDGAATTAIRRLRSAAHLVGDAVHDACALVKTPDRRLAGAVVYWAFDAAVLWAMLNTFGSPPSIAVVALAYFVGQVANTLPIPGSVSGGITGVLIAFGVPVGVALPSVLAYRAIAVWLPAPIAVAAIPRLRATIAHWGREDAAALSTAADR